MRVLQHIFLKPVVSQSNMKRTVQQITITITKTTTEVTDPELEFTDEDFALMDAAVSKHLSDKSMPVVSSLIKSTPIIAPLGGVVPNLKLEYKPDNVSKPLVASPQFTEIDVYTDGSCLGNPGAGGYGALIQYKSGLVVDEKEISGHEANTTNNRMELSAAVKALEALSKLGHTKTAIGIYTDSKFPQYVKDGINSWMANWKRNGWKTANRKPVKNQDLWVALDEQVNKFDIEWHWVKGHNGHKENERVDVIARTQAESVQKKRKIQ